MNLDYLEVLLILVLIKKIVDDEIVYNKQECE